MRWLGILLALVLVLPAAAQDAARGRRVFTRCIACHSLDPASGPTPGPSLIGVVGRPAASLPDYEYSAVLGRAGRSGLVWTEDTLDRFLTDTELFLPGTVMGLLRLPEAADRRALVDLLKATK